MKRLLLLITIFSLILTACDTGEDNGNNNNNPAPAGGGNVPAAQDVTPLPTTAAAARPTYTVQRGTVQQTLEFTGRWLPRDQVQLFFEVAGNVRNVNVRRDQAVQPGELLADLQITDLENQLATAELNLQTAQQRLLSDEEGSGQPVIDAQFNLADANISLESTQNNLPWTAVESARLGLESAEQGVINAQRAYDEARSHPEQGAGAVDSAYQSLQQAQNQLLSAQNSYYSAAQSYNNYLYTIQQAENRVLQNELALQNAMAGGGTDPDLAAAVTSAQLQVDQIRAQIAQSSLFAPFGGVILEVTIQPGAQVSAFTTVITLALPDPKEVIATIPFNDTQQLNIGRLGICQILNQPDTAVQCAVRRLPASSRDADQTVRLAAQLEGTPSGQTIEVIMPLQVRENVLWVDPAAVRTFQNRVFVVLQTPDGERPVDVVLGLQTDERVEIISGVEEGDVIVGP